MLPLDLERTTYSYVERPNTTLISLLTEHVIAGNPRARVLDVGCGAGANARSVVQASPGVRFVGVEPNQRAAELASEVIEDVFHGVVEDWLETGPTQTFDAIILSDVLEHVADPVKFLRTLLAFEGLSRATWIMPLRSASLMFGTTSP